MVGDEEKEITMEYHLTNHYDNDDIKTEVEQRKEDPYFDVVPGEGDYKESESLDKLSLKEPSDKNGLTSSIQSASYKEGTFSDGSYYSDYSY